MEKNRRESEALDHMCNLLGGGSRGSFCALLSCCFIVYSISDGCGGGVMEGEGKTYQPLPFISLVEYPQGFPCFLIVCVS